MLDDVQQFCFSCVTVIKICKKKIFKIVMTYTSFCTGRDQTQTAGGAVVATVPV